MSTHKHYFHKYQDDIEALRVEITHLENDIRDAMSDADGAHSNEEYLDTLCQRRDQASTRLEEFQAAGESGWADLRYSLRHAWMAVRNGFAKIIPH